MDFNSTLSIHLSFQPDPVAPNQVFAMTTAVTNESSTTLITGLQVEVPETPGGNPMSTPNGFPSYSCQGFHYAYLICFVFPSRTPTPGVVYPTSHHSLAPGASVTMEFPEVIPGPGYPGVPPGYYPTPSKQSTFDVQAAGDTSSGQQIIATATGYVNIS